MRQGEREMYDATARVALRVKFRFKQRDDVPCIAAMLAKRKAY
jgi:hypothetical protein